MDDKKLEIAYKWFKKSKKKKERIALHKGKEL